MILFVVAQENLRSDDKKAGRDSLAVTLFDRCVRQEISRDLVAYKFIEWHVRVDRSDHPVAVAPSLAEQKVLVQSV